jgi:hypothetical protein
MYTKDEVKQAIDNSIEHWEDIVKNPGTFEASAQNCALCKLYHPCRNDFNDWEYFNFRDVTNCDGCPIKNYTGESLCSGTPYYNYEQAYDDYTSEFIASKELKEAAINELEFLKKVRDDYLLKNN